MRFVENVLGIVTMAGVIFVLIYLPYMNIFIPSHADGLAKGFTLIAKDMEAKENVFPKSKKQPLREIKKSKNTKYGYFIYECEEGNSSSVIFTIPVDESKKLIRLTREYTQEYNPKWSIEENADWSITATRQNVACQ